jgi:hypothetical protein
MPKKAKPKFEFRDPYLRAVSILGSGGDRIYVVVANTVQIPMGLSMVGGHEVLHRVPDAVSVRQVAGRLAAQVGHVKGVVHLRMAERALMPFMKGKVKLPTNDTELTENEYLNSLWNALAKPVTTIVLAARDSFELYHVYRLLEHRLGRVHCFYDENDEVYGLGRKVMTAIATEPVNPKKVSGMLDYLPLWKPEERT